MTSPKLQPGSRPTRIGGILRQVMAARSPLLASMNHEGAGRGGKSHTFWLQRNQSSPFKRQTCRRR
jgi:hypothetical protein